MPVTSLQNLIKTSILLLAFIYAAKSSCCLRSDPISSLSDGIYLQNILISNHQPRNKDFWYFPNAPSLVLNRSKRDLVHHLLKVMKLRGLWENIEKTSIVVPVRKIYDNMMLDACAYISVVLDQQWNCSNENIESLFNKLETATIMRSLNRQRFDRKSPLFGSWGSSKNHYAYWNKHVLQGCSSCTCPGIENIEKKVIRFPLNSDICSCN